MAPPLAEVGAVIVGAALPNTTLLELNPSPVKVGVALFTVKLNVLVVLDTLLFASLTANTTFAVEYNAVGVPVTDPVEVFNERPVGKVPL